MRRVLINLFGRVQMVGFRYSTLQKAKQLQLSGFVRNIRDGTVEIEAQGDEEKIQKFIEWTKVGPPYAIIKKTIIEEKETIEENKEFDILE